MTRLLDADKLYPDRMTKDGLAISQTQIANAPTINPKEFEPLINKLVEVLPDLVNAAIEHLPEYIEAKIASQDPEIVTCKCTFDGKPVCDYYPKGCNKCAYNKGGKK